jgi:alpha-galactosidase
MIGAGSVVFSRNLTGDILGVPEFKDATITYMDIDPERLEVAGNLCRKVAHALGAKPKIETTLDRKQALEGADFVINMVQIGGFDATLVDFEIPRKYGLKFTIADTTGPGGLFRALRTYPMLSGMCRDMEQVCPRAILLNYSNPMSMNMQTVTRTSGIRAVGLCHSVQGTFEQLMGYLDEDPQKVAFRCAGINHMAFYLGLEKDGADLYPRLFEAMKRPEVYASNKVRFELMKRLGYFVTESSEHNAEYCPYFIPHGADRIKLFDVPIDEYLRRCDGIVEEFERLKLFSRSDEPIPNVHPSHEYGAVIMRSVATGKPSVIYGNMANNGTIDNLPRTAIVEAATLVDRTGLHHAKVGELPPQLVAYIQPHVSQHELFIRAVLEQRIDHVYQACMFDPLTAATLETDRIVEMCDEMIAAYGDQLPPLQKKTLVPTSGKLFPRVDPKILRDSWDAVARERERDMILDWQIIGPFPSPEPGQVSLAMKTELEQGFARVGEGFVDLSQSYSQDGNGGAKLAWKSVKAGRGHVRLDRQFGQKEWAIAYGYAEIDSVHPREAVLKCGSDDGIKIWLNGKVVHEHEVGRGYSPGSDEVTVQLKAGTNRMLVKCDNYRGAWGFGVELPRANF